MKEGRVVGFISSGIISAGVETVDAAGVEPKLNPKVAGAVAVVPNPKVVGIEGVLGETAGGVTTSAIFVTVPKGDDVAAVPNPKEEDGIAPKGEAVDGMVGVDFAAAAAVPKIEIEGEKAEVVLEGVVVEVGVPKFNPPNLASPVPKGELLPLVAAETGLATVDNSLILAPISNPVTVGSKSGGSSTLLSSSSPSFPASSSSPSLSSSFPLLLMVLNADLLGVDAAAEAEAKEPVLTAKGESGRGAGEAKPLEEKADFGAAGPKGEVVGLILALDPKAEVVLD